MSKQVILTGLRANNDLTIGNYFGAILPMVDMAKQRSGDYQINMFVPDLHTFTVPVDHSGLYQSVLDNARLFAAAGLPLDEPDIHIYRQSFIPAHSELTWVLQCFTGMGEMNRMTQFKDKSQGLSDERTTVGLFSYPILMAADILLYNAKYVPVGDDQTQHLEFARDIAQRMNSKFGELFEVPEPVSKQHEFFGKDQGLRIMDLADPRKKMSKSTESNKGVIFLRDDPEEAAKKVMSATTDDVGAVNYDKQNQPGISNLLDILALLRKQSVQSVADEFAGSSSYGDFKGVVAEEVKSFLRDFQEKLSEVDDELLISKLESSETAMSKQAGEVLLNVQKAVGLRPQGE